MKLELQKGSRSKILAGLMLGVMAIFVARLFYLQIIQYGYYVDTAKIEQVKRLTIPAKRGLIYALDGNDPVPLVMNQTVYTVFADPQTVTDSSKVIEVVKQVAGGNARADLQSLLDKKESRYQILATKITRFQADKIKSEKLKGIGFQEMSQRVYPEVSLASQILGFVNDEGVGQYGVEGQLNDRLVGKDGLLQSVTDISDVPLTIGNNNINQPAVNGDNLVLSIDRNVQSKAEQALAEGIKNVGATNGSVIVMDPQNGKIMAMSNLPSFSPAEFNKVTDANVFNNAVVSAPYEPGSVIKPFTMAIGVDKRVVTPKSTYNNTNLINVDGISITNLYGGQTGIINLQDALNQSLNTGFVTVAERLGDGSHITLAARNTMYDYFYNRFMLGKKTGIEVAGEESGNIITPTELEGNAVRYSNMSFGQGMSLTMVQVASAFCSLINGGNYYKPTVIAGIIDGSGKYIENKQSVFSNPISKSTADTLREMTHVVREYTTYGVDKPGYYIGGKTGTAQVLRDGVYVNDESIASYLGYGGSEDISRYVIMVQISGDHKPLMGPDARLIFNDISNWMLDYLKIQPKG